MDAASIFFPRQMLNSFAGWIGASVSSAFFSSLDRFSCVNVAASDGEEDEVTDESMGHQLTVVNSSNANPDENLPPYLQDPFQLPESSHDYECPENAPMDDVVPQDFVTPNKLDDVAHMKLLTSSEIVNLLNDFRAAPQHFEAKFAESMVKMGNIPMLPGTKGEIRKSCRAVNY